LKNKFALFLLRTLNRTYIFALSILVLSLIYKGGFKSFNLYSALFGLLLASLIILKTLNLIKSRSESSLREGLEITLLVILGFEAFFEAQGREFFPLIYLVTPIFFAYLGWREAAIAVILVSILEFTIHFSQLETLYRLLPLLISTFGLGYLIKSKRRRQGKQEKYPVKSGRQITELILIPNGAKEELETWFNPREDKKLQKEIRGSIEILGELLPAHSIVLYIKTKDGFFEIGDFISNSEKCIDRDQKLRIRGGYLGWAVKTKTPILVGDVKNRKENLIYYTKEIPVKSLLAVPLIAETEEEDTFYGHEPIGILLVDSLKRDAFEEKEKQITSLVSDRIVATLDKFRLSKKIQLSSKELTSFYEFTKKLSSTLELDIIFDHVVGILGDILEADTLGITLLNKETNTSTLKRAGKQRREDIEDKIIIHQGTLVGLVIETKKYFYSEDLSAREKYRSVLGKEIDFACRMKEVKSILIYPLKEPKIHANQEGENIVGCLIIGRRTKKVFNEGERSLAEIMSQEAAKAISNSLTYLKIKELAITDGLTGLYNYRYFQERLSETLTRSERFPEKVSLILVDVDKFKQLNDTHGHQAGDTLLQSLAQAISESLRRIDILARYGGDEFAIILTHTNEKGAKIVAEKIKQKVENHCLKFKGEEIRVTLSLGISTYPENASTKDSLIEKADRALYEAKRLGRNRSVHYEDVLLKEEVS
jgi:diguanylate cyclase (GGDEF)-like protein